MNKLLKLLPLLGMMLLTACNATLPTQNSGSGRYFVLMDPLTGEAGVQFSYPTAAGCQFYARTVRSELEKQGLSGSCVETSYVDSLKVAAVVRNTASEVFIGINAKTLPMCEVFLNAATSGESEKVVRVISPCTGPYSLK